MFSRYLIQLIFRAPSERHNLRRSDETPNNFYYFINDKHFAPHGTFINSFLMSTKSDKKGFAF